MLICNRLIIKFILLQNKIPIVHPRSQMIPNKSINHYPSNTNWHNPIGTILHSKTTPCKQICISTLTDPMSLITNPINYCLYLREQNAKGEFETKLYKVKTCCWYYYLQMLMYCILCVVDTLYSCDYCILIAQADVWPTITGGAQIVFNDIKCSKQSISPIKIRHEKTLWIDEFKKQFGMYIRKYLMYSSTHI